MASYVLDTNIVSALMSRDGVILDRLEDVSRAAVGVPVVVFAEIAFGVERLPNGRKKESLRDAFALVRAELSQADWTDDVTDAFGRLKASLEKSGQRIDDFDITIAAHAIAADAVLVSSNTKHMSRVPGIRLEDWSQP